MGRCFFTSFAQLPWWADVLKSSLSALVETAKHCFQASTLLLKQPSWRTIVLHKSISNVVVAGAPEMLVLPEAKQGIPAV